MAWEVPEEYPGASEPYDPSAPSAAWQIPKPWKRLSTQAATMRELLMGHTSPMAGWPLNRAYSAKDYFDILGMMRTGFPGTYKNPATSVIQDLNAKIQDKEAVLATMIAPGDWVNKWLIGNDLKELYAQLDAASASQERSYLASEQERLGQEGKALTRNVYISPEEKYQQFEALRQQAINIWGRQQELAGTEVGFPTRETAPPIPEWMQPYISKEGLIPLGAQAGLGTDELQQLMGYMGWEKGGKPTGFTEEYAQALGNLPTWWEEYTRGAQKLFPTSVKMPKPRWGRSR